MCLLCFGCFIFINEGRALMTTVSDSTPQDSQDNDNRAALNRSVAQEKDDDCFKNHPRNNSQHARRLIIVRHGQTSHNVEHRLQGDADIPLNDHGLWQAQESAKALRHLYVLGSRSQNDAIKHGALSPSSKQVVVSSPLTRASQTAHAFADALNLPVYADSDLVERSYGVWEGLSVRDLAREHSEEFLKLVGGLETDPELKIEPIQKVATRAYQAICRWIYQVDNETDLFIFTHGSLIAKVMPLLLGIDDLPKMYGRFAIPENAFWTVLKSIPSSEQGFCWELKSYNKGPAISETVNWNMELE